MLTVERKPSWLGRCVRVLTNADAKAATALLTKISSYSHFEATGETGIKPFGYPEAKLDRDESRIALMLLRCGLVSRRQTSPDDPTMWIAVTR